MEHVVKRGFKILPILMVLFAPNSFGQATYQDAVYTGGDSALVRFLGKELLSRWHSAEDKVCIESETYARFTIDEAGAVKDIKFYEVSGTPRVIEKIITSVLNATSGSWHPQLINGKPVKSATFLIPFKYDLEAGCEDSTMRLAKVRPVGLVKFLTDILNSDKIIILKPVVVFSHD